jgi:anti-sigma B factor antagonist
VAIHATTRDLGAVTVVDVSGRLTLGEESAALRHLLGDLVGQGRTKIVLDLGDVDYIDSSGIGELVSGYRTVTKAGGDLKLLHLTQKVHDLLQITRLFLVFDVHSDEAVALRSFA